MTTRQYSAADLAFQTVSGPASPAGGALAGRRITGGATILAASITVLFLHATYQPTMSVALGSTSVDITLADLAIAAVVGAAALRVFREGLVLLRPAAVPLIALGVFLAIVVLSCFVPVLRDDQYGLTVHLVSAAKFCWYALLAPATVVLVDGSRGGIVLRALVSWSVVATAWAVLQFAGFVDEFEGRRPGQREPSFVGIHDFAALSGAALMVGLLGLALRRESFGRGWTIAAVLGGAFGVVLSGAMTGVVGVWLAVCATLVLVARHGGVRLRHLVAVAGIVLAVTLATAAMRATTLERFAEFLGLRERTEQTAGIESYGHRTLLAYIGVRIFLDHPIIGTGWQASSEEFAFTPYLDDARRRFPDEPDEAFPSTTHRWGVQNAYVQALADLGLVGFTSLLVAVGAALVIGVRRSRATPLALVGVAWMLVAAGVWLGIGLVAGLPLAALTWIGFGLATARPRRDGHDHGTPPPQDASARVTTASASTIPSA